MYSSDLLRVHEGKYGCGLTLTGEPSSKVFSTATGHQAKAKEKGRWEHKLREPAGTFDMVPDITLDPLSSTSKLCDAGYFQVFNSKETRIYDARTTKIIASKPPSSKGGGIKPPPYGASCLPSRLRRATSVNRPVGRREPPRRTGPRKIVSHLSCQRRARRSPTSTSCARSRR